MELPSTPEIIEHKADGVRSSLTPEIIESKDASLRKSSIGVSGISSNGEKILPNYLRASTGSCHDLCKYGRHRAFEEKEKRPILKGKKSTLSEDKLSSKSSSLQMRKKKPVVELTSSPVPGTQSCDTPKHGTQHALEVKDKHPILEGKKATSAECQSPIKSASTRAREKNPAAKLTSPGPGAQNCDKHLIMEGKKATSAECQSPIKTASPRAMKKNPATKLTSSDPGTQNCDKTQIYKQETKNVKQKASSPGENLANVAKSSVSSKPKRVTDFPLNSTRDRSLRRDSNVKTGKNSGASKIVQKKDPVPQKAASLPTPPSNRTNRKMQKNPAPKNASPQKDEDVAKKDEPMLPIDENVSVKTLYVIEPKPAIKSLELNPVEDGRIASLSSPSTSSSSPPSILCKGGAYIESELDGTDANSEYDETESDSEYEETESQNQCEVSKEEYKRRPRSGALKVNPEDNDPGHKLKFRRGKVIEPQSEHNTPRRLKFRKGRQVGEVQNSASKRKSFKKREVIDGCDTDKAKSEKVVLRHQDVTGKKDGQGLFNNVIEETANKLVETRKSKVKALVGAFETVISLQETRPLSSSG